MRRQFWPAMGIKQALTFYRNHMACSPMRLCMFAATLVLISALAAAQDETAPSQKAKDSGGFLAAVSRWFEEQTANMGSSFKDARKKVENFSSAAGDAAKTTVDGAKDAAGAVVRIPAARAVSGHEKCNRRQMARLTASPPPTRCARLKVSNRERVRHDDSRGVPSQGLHVRALDRA